RGTGRARVAGRSGRRGDLPPLRLLHRGGLAPLGLLRGAGLLGGAPLRRGCRRLLLPARPPLRLLPVPRSVPLSHASPSALPGHDAAAAPSPAYRAPPRPG